MTWIEQLNVECLKGDLLDQQTQAIACNVNVMLNLNYRLGQQIEHRCGPELVRDLEVLRDRLPGGRLPLGHAITTAAYNMAPCEKLILFAWWGEDNAFTPQFIYKCLSNLLREALTGRIESLAVPLFGTGSRDVRALDLAVQIVAVLKDFNRLNNAPDFSLQDIYFVSNKSSDVADVDNYVMGRLWRSP